MSFSTFDKGKKSKMTRKSILMSKEPKNRMASRPKGRKGKKRKVTHR